MIKLFTELEYNTTNCLPIESFMVYIKGIQHQHINVRSDIKERWLSRHEHRDGKISFSNKNGNEVSFEELSAIINKFGYMFK